MAQFVHMTCGMKGNKQEKKKINSMSLVKLCFDEILVMYQPAGVVIYHMQGLMGLC